MMHIEKKSKVSIFKRIFGKVFFSNFAKKKIYETLTHTHLFIYMHPHYTPLS